MEKLSLGTIHKLKYGLYDPKKTTELIIPPDDCVEIVRLGKYYLTVKSLDFKKPHGVVLKIEDFEKAIN